MNWNYMVRVICHKAELGWAWANGCKAKNGTDYRCTACGAVGHDKARG